MTFTRTYLSPEPLLQNATWARNEASDGYATATYAYARNNPLKYTDPTGLFAWNVECPALGAINRGASFFYTDVFSSPVVRYGGGSSALVTASLDACDDAEFASRIEAENRDNPMFWIQRDCWKALRAQIRAACREQQKKQSTQPNSCPPGGSGPNTPIPPQLGYANQ